MARRAKKGQEAHDAKVAETAKRLSRQGYSVKADLPGSEYQRPKAINGRVPDIVARKGGKTVIREVETPSTVRSDKSQQEVFRKHAEKKSNTEFRVLVAKKKK